MGEAWECRHLQTHLRLLCTGSICHSTHANTTPTNTKQSISHTYLIHYVRNLWDPLISIHAPHTPISLSSIFVCVSSEQRCTNWRRTQHIGMLRPGQRWMLRWNSALGTTGPKTSSCSSAMVGHAVIVVEEKATDFRINDKYCPICKARQCSSVLQYVCCAQDGLRDFVWVVVQVWV